jgi:ATP synthase protein I
LTDPIDEKDRVPDDEGLSDLAKAYRKAGPYISASTTLVAAVGVGAAGGYWLDRKLGFKTPWMFLLGVALGMTGGFISFFNTVLRLGKKK